MRTNRIRVAVVVAGLTLASVALASPATASPMASPTDRPVVGEPAPALALTGVDGETYSLGQNMEGPRVVIFFRGSW